MAGEWRETQLGDVVELKRGYDLPQKARRPGKNPLVSSSGITDTHAEAMVKGPGVVTGRYGTLGQVFFIEQDFWPLNTTLYVRDFKRNDPRFIGYLLRTLDFFAYSDKAAVPGLNRNDLHQAQVRLPADIEEQRTIAHILGTLDDKIELNRRMNQTLEAMARALFKSWFVDFDGVPAENMQESELGLIPGGWSLSTLGTICKAHGGFIQTGPFGSQLHASDYTFSGVPVAMPQDMADRRIQTDKIARISEDNAQRLFRHRMLPGDIVFSRRGDVGRHALVSSVEAGWLCGTGCLLVRPGADAAYSTYVACALTRDDSSEWLARHAVGATMPNINTGILSALPMLCPPEEVVADFGKAVGPIDAAVSANRAASQTLAQLRDSLLPKLISGELRVKDAERIAKAAA